MPDLHPAVVAGAEALHKAPQDAAATPEMVVAVVAPAVLRWAAAMFKERADSYAREAKLRDIPNPSHRQAKLHAAVDLEEFAEEVAGPLSPKECAGG